MGLFGLNGLSHRRRCTDGRPAFCATCLCWQVAVSVFVFVVCWCCWTLSPSDAVEFRANQLGRCQLGPATSCVIRGARGGDIGHRSPPGSSEELGWAGCGPGGATWPLDRWVRWPVTRGPDRRRGCWFLWRASRLNTPRLPQLWPFRRWGSYGGSEAPETCGGGEVCSSMPRAY
jgi:hypothetical protein